MSAKTTPILTIPPLGVATRRLSANNLLLACRRYFLGVAGALILVSIVAVAVLAPVFATHDPAALDASARLQSPSGEHWFGTDNLGRDTYSRVVYGSRTSLFISLSAVGLGAFVGVTLGLLSAYFRGWVDMMIQRLVDALLSFPTVVLALTIVAVLGASRLNVILAIAMVMVPTFARVVRATALGVMAGLYVEAARAVGVGHGRMLIRYLLPNCAASVIVLATLSLGNAVLAEASLSFLGLGPPPPAPSWGNMLSGPAQQFLRVAPWMAIFPGIAISLLVLSFNLAGDALRDASDPRFRGRH